MTRHWHVGGVALALSLFAAPASALQPPRPGEIEELKKGNRFRAQMDNAERLGNHRIDPVLLRKALIKGKRKLLEAQGRKPAEIDQLAPQFTPPPGWRGMPTTGTVKVLALLIEFPDYPHGATNTQTFMQSALFGTGDTTKAPYESLQSYYSRASYGQLTITGSSLGWYRTAYNRPIDTNDAAAWQVPTNLIKEVITYYKGQGHNFAQYDNDGDGVIDYLLVIWTGPTGPWASLWWGWQTTFGDRTFTVDGKRLGRYSWQWEAPSGGAYSPRVPIHETGHALGLPDLYDYDNSVGPKGGVGGLDMMDANYGDHNCFSKWVLGWLTPAFAASGSQVVHMQPSGTSQQSCVVVWPDFTAAEQFGEMYAVQNRQRVGNDSGTLSDGMLVWHIDASLNSTGASYAYNNSTSAHKLVRLMEADGLEEIERNLSANAGDYWGAGKVFDRYSLPASLEYDGTDSRVAVHHFSNSGTDAWATFEITGTTVVESGWTDDGAVVRLTAPADKVGIGTSTPGYKLTVGDVATTDATNYVEVNAKTWTGLLFHGGGRGAQITYNHAQNALAFGTSPGDGTGPWERLRLTGTGNVGIGTASPAYKLTVGDVGTPETANYVEINAKTWTGVIFHGGGRGGSIQYNHAQNTMTFGTSPGDGTGPWERLKLTGDGLIAFTPKNLASTQPALSGSQFLIAWNQSNGRGETAFYQHGGAGWKGGYDFWSERNGAGKQLLASLQDTGNLLLRGSVGSLSDARLKVDVATIPDALTKVRALRGVSFAWKDPAGHDGGKHLGLIAQEVQPVVPEVVTRGVGDEYYAVEYDKLVPVLVEALKEQQAIIQRLSDRVTELEAAAARRQGHKPSP